MMKGGETSSSAKGTEAGEETSSRQRNKTPIMEAPLIGNTYDKESADRSYGNKSEANGMKRGIGIIDFVVRLGAIVATLAATVAMGTAEQTLPFFTQFFQFQASYDDLPTFTFFVIANAISAGYLILSLPFSIVTIVRPHAKAPRLFLITFDTVALTLTTAAAGASAAIVYLAHKGNANANWLAICQQFDDFCKRTSGSVVAAFIAVVLIIMLVIISTLALRSH